jgi:hypothetical protein
VDLIGATANSGWTWNEKSKEILISLAAKSTKTILKIQ